MKKTTTKQEINAKIEQLFCDSKTKIYTSGSLVTLAHQDPKGVMLLTEGIVEQYDITPDGNKMTINMFKPGAFFPMSWAVNKTPNEYFYAAASDVKVRMVDADRAVQFLKDNPDVLFDLLSRVYIGTDALLRRLVLTAGGVASSRLIYALLIEAYRFGVPSGSTAKTVHVKRTSLAERSGLARETVSRELHKLQQEGLLTCTTQKIVLDVDKLERKLEAIS